MILDSLKAKAAPCTDNAQLQAQYSLNPAAWDSAEKFLQSDLTALPAGKHPLEGGAYANVQDYVSKDYNKYEYHENYIDIQYVASGIEQIGICPRENLVKPMGPYNPEKDCALFEESTGAAFVTMSPDSFFTVLFPNEAHCPGLKKGDNVPVRKIVVKIPFAK